MTRYGSQTGSLLVWGRPAGCCCGCVLRPHNLYRDTFVCLKAFSIPCDCLKVLISNSKQITPAKINFRTVLGTAHLA